MDKPVSHYHDITISSILDRASRSERITPLTKRESLADQDKDKRGKRQKEKNTPHVEPESNGKILDIEA